MFYRRKGRRNYRQCQQIPSRETGNDFLKVELRTLCGCATRAPGVLREFLVAGDATDVARRCRTGLGNDCRTSGSPSAPLVSPPAIQSGCQEATVTDAVELLDETLKLKKRALKMKLQSVSNTK